MKTCFVDAVTTHNLNLHRTGLLREIYLEYIEYVYDKKVDDIFYCDDLRKFAYKTLTLFLASWEIFTGLGYDEDEDADGDQRGEDDEYIGRSRVTFWRVVRRIAGSPSL